MGFFSCTPHPNRKNPTIAEAMLRARSRTKQLGTLKFRRQLPFSGYIVDFYCEKSRLAIELDGSVRLHPDQAEWDFCRLQALPGEGAFVLRSWTSEVINGIEKVLEEIRKTAAAIHISINLPAKFFKYSKPIF